ncbi:ABC transporter ATP-binding protein [Methylomonas rapida]|uniref:ABC transporter ATP-binding protein n=1 Tax=Methylomonas rapida TaxID=2963939 RepID=A0ABY7GQ12_9GAMM|nr:ABC transporter ATP-binding protein [Methylomonas rapida]WAR46599.1 ABC transporter ATP-binding protein [Methylomonas rapida]
MTDIAIKVENLSKCYQIYNQPHDRLKQSIYPRLQRLVRQQTKQYFREFWALKDVSFEIKKGETVAIIGRNGSGKSTLLQMICGTLSPTSGTLETQGRIAALLELGAGFNPEFSGRENIYLNGSLLGLSRDEIDNRFDDIAAFADIGQFIDQPIKTYSSGMAVRLAFSIHAQLDPDILIVDEALSVGDYFFQQKCFAHLRKLREDGLTLLFVSHDMGTVRDLCPSSIYLSKGEAVFIGDSQEAIRAYLSEKSNLVPVESNPSLKKPDGDSDPSESTLQEALNVALWRRDMDSLSNNDRLLAVVVRNEKGEPTTAVRMGEKLIFQIYFRLQPDDKGHFALEIKNKYDQLVSSTGSYMLGFEPITSKCDLYGLFEFEIECMIESGLYSFSVSYGLPIGQNNGVIMDQTDWIGPLQIKWDYETEIAPFLGMFGLPVKAHNFIR